MRARVERAPMTAVHWSPIQRDALVFLGPLGAFMAGVWIAVSYGVAFTGPAPGIQAWAAALILTVGAAFAASVAWWYHVAADERDPARGEFTIDPATGTRPRHIREGHGSFRLKSPGWGVVAEPEYRMTTEPGFVPRTRARWLAWFALMGLALAGAGALVSWAKGTEDPLSPLMAAVGLLGAAVMLGALGVGEMSHSGPWARQPPPSRGA